LVSSISAPALFPEKENVMARTFPLLFAVIATGLAPGRSSADHATVTQAATSSPAQGQISAKGTYTIMAGYSLLEINLYVVPDGGGEKGQAICTSDAKTLTWTGGAIEGLVSGTTYNVWAETTYGEAVTPNRGELLGNDW
jgi:hypothetical protein